MDNSHRTPSQERIRIGNSEKGSTVLTMSFCFSSLIVTIHVLLVEKVSFNASVIPSYSARQRFWRHRRCSLTEQIDRVTIGFVQQITRLCFYLSYAQIVSLFVSLLGIDPMRIYLGQFFAEEVLHRSFHRRAFTGARDTSTSKIPLDRGTDFDEESNRIYSSP
jgi:hypothetical protein